MPRKLQLIAPRKLVLAEYDKEFLPPNGVRAKAVMSGISHGTEMNQFCGTAPIQHKRKDLERQIFVDDDSWQPYPREIGYEWVGQVVEVGPESVGFRPGDFVHLPVHHRETHVFETPGETIYGAIKPLPEDLPPEKAVMLSLAGVALQAIHDAHIKLGDRVAVFGLGVIGLFTLQFARMNGASWIDAVDPIDSRRSLAETLGADFAVDPLSADTGLEIKSNGPVRGADIAIEVSGNYAALHEAIRCVRVGGTIVAAGYYQGGGTDLRLGEEWHHNRVTMVSSMGSHHCPHRDFPLWDRGRVQDETARLLAGGELKTDGIDLHRVPFEDAQSAYDSIENSPGATLKTVLTYG